MPSSVDVTWLISPVEVIRKSKAALWGVIRVTAFAIEADVKAAIQTGAKTGRVYTRRGKGKRRRLITHQASAPGEAPATDTGFLVNSISTKLEPEKMRAIVRVGAEYAVFLEYGTVRMAARPFFTPVVEAQKSAFAKRLKEVV
jgi:HK97 gp10 family phage protein